MTPNPKKSPYIVARNTSTNELLIFDGRPAYERWLVQNNLKVYGSSQAKNPTKFELVGNHSEETDLHHEFEISLIPVTTNEYAKLPITEDPITLIGHTNTKTGEFVKLIHERKSDIYILRPLRHPVNSTVIDTTLEFSEEWQGREAYEAHHDFMFPKED